MQTYSPSIRLYVNFPLKKETNFCVQDKQAHYLSNVMRLKIGRKFLVFNGVDGEFEAEIVNKLNNEIKCKLNRKIRKQLVEPRLNLIFSLVKKDRVFNIIEKCTELGVKSIIPVISEKCKFKSISTNKFKRWKNIVRESSEQSFRSVLLDIKEIINFKDACLQSEGLRIFCNEFEIKNNINLISNTDLQNDCRRNISIFVGPVSGYSDDEIAWAKKCDLKSVSLGKRILRTETAAIVSVANVINQLT